MTVVNCILVDDEPLARNVLESYIRQYPQLKLLGICRNAAEALVILNKTKVDLIFCDIQMPGLNGLEFLSSLKHLPKVIITSAYRDYAIEGFQIGVVDYLLKPFSMERFSLAMNRAIGDAAKQSSIGKHEADPGFLFFKVGNSIEKVIFQDICFVEAYGNYCKLFFKDNEKFLIVNSKISDLEKELDSRNFIRIHKSYLVNSIHIQKVATNRVLIKEQSLPVSDSYKKNFRSRYQP